MRVLQINTICKSGSTGKIAYDIHTSLLKDGYESAICYGRGPVIDEPNIYKFGSELGLRVHVLITRIFGVTGMASNWSTNKLLKYIKQFKPDVVHVHNIHGYYVNSYRLLNYLKKNNIKTVITMHDDWLLTGRCAGYYICEQWRNGCGRCPFTYIYPKSIGIDLSRLQYRIKRKVFENFNYLTLVVPSKWLCEKVKQSYLQSHHTKVIHNGIDVEKIFYPQEHTDIKKRHDIKDEKIILAVTPDFSDEKKGGKYVLQLAQKLANEHIKIVIIGVNKQVRNLPNNIIAIARTEDQIELAKYYSMADVFLLTSRAESFSMVCAESLACGTPVVGFKAGAPEEIVPSEMSRFVDYGDIDSLKNEVLDMIKKKYKKNANKVYSKEKMYKGYLYTYLKEDYDD